MNKREKFLQIYSRLPIGLRNEIILSLDKFGPVTWTVAYIEITNNTDLGNQILEKLEILGIL